MRIGKLTVNEIRCGGYKLILDWPGFYPELLEA